MNTPEIIQKYADTIRALIPVNELSQEVQNEIIKNAVLIELKKKQQIFKQGDRDNFSYYLLDGEIQLEANNQVHNSIVGATDRAQYPMAQLQPRQFTGIAKVDSVVMRIERNSLDKMLVMNQGQNNIEDDFGDGISSVEVDVIDGDDEESLDWMTVMLQSEIFSSIPTANIHQLFALMEPVEYKVGDNVITQGEAGQNYYIIQEGQCEVLRSIKPGAKETKLAVLKAGDGFGEEALITETTRNATIKMLTDGVVAQLSKDNFVTLIQNPTLKTVSYEKAKEIVEKGGKWLDVRFKNEHDRNSVAGSLHIPLNILRLQADKLDPAIQYVLYCDTGGRSSAASFLLMERGISTCYLDGGLLNNPELAPPEDVTQAPKISEPVVPAVPQTPEEPTSIPPVQTATSKPAQPTVTPKQETAPKIEPSPAEEDDIDPEIMATVLDAELKRTNMDIERARKQDQTVIRNQETAKKLDEERARIEQEKKKNEAEIQKMRQQEEQRLKEMEQASEKRMEEERKKIEEVYSRNAEELERLENMKLEAEEKMQAERQKLENDADEARKNKQETDIMRQELEAARKAMEEESKKQRLEQEEMRKKIEMEARANIEMERRKLADQFAKNNQEVEQARREKAAAEAGRIAAKQEAELMIEEYKSQHNKSREEEEVKIKAERLKLDKSREEEEIKIKAERLKLEQEQQKIQEALIDLQKAKAEAEALKRAAAVEIAVLKAKQFQEDITQSKTAQADLKDKIKNAQEKLAKASEQAVMVEKDEENAVVAQQVNQEDLDKKRAEEEELNKQLQADLEGFKGELEEQEKAYASSTTQLEHMKRIRERAEAAKKNAIDANSGLLSDISAQLGNKD